MKLTIPALAIFATAAKANFDVYFAALGGTGIAGNSFGFQVYDNPPACGDTLDWIWRSSGDVSGGKYGVRCEGDGCCSSCDPKDIEEMEFNFNGGDDYHFTMYADRDHGLYDGSKKIGNCFPFPGDDFYCGAGVGRVEGQRAIRCLINSINSEDINDNKPK